MGRAPRHQLRRGSRDDVAASSLNGPEPRPIAAHRPQTGVTGSGGELPLRPRGFQRGS